MISPKLIVLLQSFTKYDLNAFDKFIHSPFHNENQDMIRLFEIIHPIIRQNSSIKKENDLLSKDKIWIKLFNDRKYHDEQMRRICSDLLKKCYSFLIYKNISSSELDEIIHLLPAINTPDLEKHFTGVIRQAFHIQKKSSLKNADHHFFQNQLEENQFTFLEKTSIRSSDFTTLENADYHLDCYYIIKKLKHYCDSLAYKNIFAVEPNIHLFPSFLEYIERSEFINEPCVRTYLLIVKMLLFPEEEIHFKNVKQLLNKQYNCFTFKELNTIYIYLKNYCIDTKINNGQSQYFWELFDVFKTLIEKEIIFIEGNLDPQDYKNIIAVGCHIKEFDWTENFIQTYTVRLPKKSQDNDLSYNLAAVYFHKEDYPKVIEQLREVEYKNLSYIMGGRLMLLKTYYEQKEFKALDSLLDSYSIYLRRNKLISKEVRQQLMNGIRFTRKLISVAPYDKKRIEKIKEQITNCKALAAKKWLLEKVEELA